MALADIHTCFSGNPLDRADYLRTDPEIFGNFLRRPDARVALLAAEAPEQAEENRIALTNDSRILTDADGDIAWQATSLCDTLPVTTLIFLGLDGKAPRYAALLAQNTAELESRFAQENCKFRDGRGIALKLGEPHPSLGIIAQAKSMLLWHESHRFCAKCGAESRLIKAGYERQCDHCGAHHFPRTDPVVIMLVRRGDKALVGRGPTWPEGHFSALAGFMEPGESMEEAVAREIHEEVGLRATKVQYVASQPWPWPSSLMIGAYAWVDDTAITLDTNEVAEAIWVSKNDVRASIKGNDPRRLLPPPLAIAHNLMQAWLNEQG